MSQFTKLSILCDQGSGNATITIVLPIPTQLLDDADEPAAWLAYAQSVSKGGFWSQQLSAGSGPGTFYPPAAIRAITPE